MAGSISVSGLLGGTAGQIDVTSLVANLMQAESVPQQQLKDQLSTVTAQLSAYQRIATALTSVQTAATALTGDAGWGATTATSSSTAVVATAGTGAAAGHTTLDVLAVAAAQVTVVPTGAGGAVLTDPAAGLTITGADGVAHTVVPASGSAKDVAAAITKAGLGVRASVVSTDDGDVLQLTGTRTGTAHAFTVGGTAAASRTVVAANDAKVAVGGASGYTVTSSTNTFTGVVPGVTFSVGAVATGVGIDVAADGTAVANAVKALVTAANSARGELAADSGQGAVLQGSPDVRGLVGRLGDAVAQGTTGGGSLGAYGIGLDKTGTVIFDAAAFTAAWAADPDGTRAAIAGSFVQRLGAAAGAAVDSTTGSVTTAITGLTTNGTRLSGEIDDWTSRLADVKTAMEAKYAAMQTALARLQSQQTYLTSMFTSITKSSSSS